MCPRNGQALPPLWGRERNSNSCNRNSLIFQDLFCFDLIFFCYTRASCWGCLICRKSWIIFGKQYKILSPSSFLRCLRLKEDQVSITNQELNVKLDCSSCNWKGTGLNEAGPGALKGMAGCCQDPQLIFLSTFSDLEGTELMNLRHDIGRTPCWFPAQMPLLLFPLPRD